MKAGYYDLIICNNVLHNAKNIYRVLDQFQDILAEGGALIVADTTGENYSLLTSMEFHAGLSDFDDFRKEGSVCRVLFLFELLEGISLSVRRL